MNERPGRAPGDGSRSSGAPEPAWKRIAWFVLLWIGGVLTVTAISYAIRLAIL